MRLQLKKCAKGNFKNVTTREIMNEWYGCGLWCVRLS
jgi:hypothetical protein